MKSRTQKCTCVHERLTAEGGRNTGHKVRNY